MVFDRFENIPRVDADDKVRGRPIFAADRLSDDMLHAALATSRIARGRVTAIDTSGARAVPGVRLVMTHEDFADRIEAPGFLFVGGTAFQSFQPMVSPDIAWRGQPIALVVADTLEAAAEAASLIDATYESAPFAATMASPEATPIAQASADEHAPDLKVGDAEAAYGRAPITVDALYRSPAQSQNAMELISTVAEWDGDELLIHEGSQSAGNVRAGVAGQLGIPAANVHVMSAYCGGGFGQKNSLQTQTVFAALAARELGRPVKLVVTRSEMFNDASYRPASVHRMRLGADESGKLLAGLYDFDAATSRHDFFPASYAEVVASMYAVENFRSFGRLVRIDTQTPGPMRAPFEHAPCFALECAIDEVAYRVGVDPVELRIANDARVDTVSGKPFSTRFVTEALRIGAERFGWSAREAKPGSMVADDGSLIGYGVAIGAYPGSVNPMRATLRVTAAGEVILGVGGHEIGQGLRTTLAATVGRRLGVAPEDVTALLGDTDHAPQLLTAGSWGSATAVPAADLACKRLLAELSERGGTQGTPAERLAAAGMDEHSVEVVRALPGQPDAVLSERLDAGLIAPMGPEFADFVTYSYIAHFVEVRIDPGTGRVRVPRVTSVADCGRVLSPRTAESQVRGGVVWGLGAVLREESEVDPRFGGFLNADLAEYLVPVNADIGEIDVAFVDEPDTQFSDSGLKSLGEVVMCGLAPAVANAIHHATGKRLRSMPFRAEDLIV